MWHWALPTSTDELLEHIDMVPTLTLSQLKDQLEQRDLPVSGTKQKLENRLLFYFHEQLREVVLNMKHPEILGPFHHWFVKQHSGPAGWDEHLVSFVIPQLRNFLVNFHTTLNWNSFPTVFLDA